MQIIRPLDRILNGITMYRLMLYGLAALAAIAVALAAMGMLAVSASALLGSLAVLLVVCYAANRLFAVLLDAATGGESALITALILFFVMAPPAGLGDIAMVALTGFIAMASKYLVAFHRRHLFNPAALAATIVSLTGLYAATWWVATPALLPFTILLGLLVVRKIRRFQLVLAFTAAALGTMIMVMHGRPVADVLAAAFTSWPLVFLGTVMLTEPATAPPRNRDLLIYGAGVGVIFASQSHIGPLYSTPEVALVVGNIFTYIMGPKYRLRLTLARRTDLSPDITEFTFTADRPHRFAAGQYMDVMLPHSHADGRGNRRSFSIASAPSEPVLQFTTRFYEPSSSYKAALRGLKPGATLSAGQTAGDFVMPPNSHQKLVFIAGGIGITPFRSMVQEFMNTRQSRDIVVFYSANATSDFVYRELLEQAKTAGVTAHYLLTGREVPADWPGMTGFLTPEIIKAKVPDYATAIFMLSGPNIMVESYRAMLRELGVKGGRIKTDYFTGY